MWGNRANLPKVFGSKHPIADNLWLIYIRSRSEKWRLEASVLRILKEKEVYGLFYAFDLIFEINKLVDRHESSELKIVCEAMDSYKNPEDRIVFAQILNNFNTKIKYCDIFCGDLLTGDTNQKKYRSLIERQCSNELYTRIKKVLGARWNGFLQLYEILYQEKIRGFIKKLWDAMPSDRPVVGAERGFKNIFEDLHDNVLVKYPTLFIKQLKDVGNMYRCRSWAVNDDYKLMLPDERYVKNNRWNPDGIAYLYLSCDDKFQTFDGVVNMAQKTCFEEIRLVDGSEVAVCQFKPLKKDAKIIDLCYEDTDPSKLSKEFKTPPKEAHQIVVNKILKDTMLAKKITKLVQENSWDGFVDKAEPDLKKILKETGLDMKIDELVHIRTSTLMLSLIDKSIFEAVDIETDPELKTYIPFREFSQFLIKKGYDGIIYRSTRMNMIGLSGKNLVLFNKMHATYKEKSMKKYKYTSGKYVEFV